MCLVLFEFEPDQKLEVTQDSSLKCLGQLAQISLDSAVLAVRPASAVGGSHLLISVSSPSVVFRPQVLCFGHAVLCFGHKFKEIATLPCAVFAA